MTRARAKCGEWGPFLQKAIAYREDGCLDWPFGKTGAGYGVVTLDGRVHAVHRLICQIVNGKPSMLRIDVAHRCGRPACVNPTHLYWATHQENMHDKVTHGTLARGEKAGNTKLTIDQVRQIRQQRSRDPKDVAAEFGVSRPAIYDIWKMKSWSWLD